MAPDPLVDRLRSALAGQQPTEVRMFGGLSFMVDGRMLVAARNGGDLLVRIDPDANDEAMAIPGASEAFMGAERPMGPSWVSVDHEHLATEADLRRWLTIALDFHARHGG